MSQGEAYSEVEAVLVGQGWKRQSLNCEPRLSELVEIYKEYGFEVTLVPVAQTGLDVGCGECHRVDPGSCAVIFTRKRAS